MLEKHLVVGWEYNVDIVIEAPVDIVRGWVPRSIGLLEPVDEDSTRLVGITSNPEWYVQQLIAIPAAYHIVGCTELQDSARDLGQRLVNAGAITPTPKALRW